MDLLTTITEIIEEWEFLNTMVEASCPLDDKLFLDVIGQVSESELDRDDSLL